MSKLFHFGFDKNDGLGCFGEFDHAKILCKKHCVLRLRCAILQDHNLRMELLEDWMTAQDEAVKLQ